MDNLCGAPKVPGRTIDRAEVERRMREAVPEWDREYSNPRMWLDKAVSACVSLLTEDRACRRCGGALETVCVGCREVNRGGD